MTSNYEKIILENLTTIYHTLSEKNLEEWLPARRSGRSYEFQAFHGKKGVPGTAGDFSFLLFPFPKIALGYIFYLPDEDFPPSVTCLYSANAQRFMPLDGLADVAEYTSRKIIELIGS
jgi:hypothetical protein